MILKGDAQIKTYKCTKCLQIKPESEFYNNKTMPRGKTYWCKVCTNYQNNFIQKETKARWAAAKYNKLKEKNPRKLIWKRAAARARQLRREFSISIEDIIIPQKCPYLGILFSNNTRDTSPSLDRIDASKGYIKGNVQVISHRANRMKSNATIQELLTFARGILEVHAKEGTDCDHQG